jgi:hypothetical protein
MAAMWRFVASCHFALLLIWLSLSQLPRFCCRAATPSAFVVCGNSNSNSIPIDTTVGARHQFCNDNRRRNVLSYTRRLPLFAGLSDSEEELESVRSWKSTSSMAAFAKVVFRAPSLLDAEAFVEVKRRTDGWHTLGIVGGPTKSIYHGVFRTDEITGKVDPSALGPSEYIRTMASAALCLSAAHPIHATVNDNNRPLQSHWNKAEEAEAEAEAADSSPSPPPPPSPQRFLHMGYGTGSLMRFLEHTLPESHHETIELDSTVVEAAIELGLWNPSSPRGTVVVGDALEVRRSDSYSDSDGNAHSPGFRGVCIDVFDGANLMPPGFYAVPFLENVRDRLLARDDECCSFCLHNFHVGTERLEAQLKDAMESYRTVFGRSGALNQDDGTTEHSRGVLQHSLYKIDSLNTNNHGGNTILIAIQTNGSSNDLARTTGSSCNGWADLAALATDRWNATRFDVTSRIAHAEPF